MDGDISVGRRDVLPFLSIVPSASLSPGCYFQALLPQFALNTDAVVSTESILGSAHTPGTVCAAELQFPAHLTLWGKSILLEQGTGWMSPRITHLVLVSESFLSTCQHLSLPGNFL